MLKIPRLPNSQQRGFTLLELLIVLAIFGLFAAMAYGGLNYVLNSRQRLEASMADLAEWQRGYQRLRNDFQLLSLRSVRNAANLSEPALRFEEFGAKVEFTHSSWRNPLKVPRAGLVRVVVRFDEREKTLVRESYGVLDRSSDDIYAQVVLLNNVASVQWRFMDENREWQPRWPPSNVAAALGSGSAAAKAPLAVELTVTGAGLADVRWVFRIGESNPPAAVALPQGTPEQGPPAVAPPP